MAIQLPADEKLKNRHFCNIFLLILLQHSPPTSYFNRNCGSIDSPIIFLGPWLQGEPSAYLFCWSGATKKKKKEKKEKKEEEERRIVSCWRWLLLMQGSERHKTKKKERSVVSQSQEHHFFRGWLQEEEEDGSGCEIFGCRFRFRRPETPGSPGSLEKKDFDLNNLKTTSLPF